MSKSQRSFRFAFLRFAVIAIISIFSLTLAVAGTSAAGLSFFDTVKEFFGLRPTQTTVTTEPLTNFGPGNLAVERIEGTTGNSTAVSVVEYDTSGNLQQTISMPNAPTRPTSNPFNLTDAGNSTSNGQMTRSSDGTKLILPGYNGISTDTSITGSNAATISRTIGVIDNAASVDTSRSYNMLSGNTYRSVTSTDGTVFWAAGQPGMVYVDAVGTITTLGTVNTRVVRIFNNTLYYSTGAGTVGIYQLGTAGSPPTSGTPTATLLITVGGTNPSPYGFSINPAGDVAYVADDRSIANGGGIIKYTFNGSVWSAAYTLNPSTGAATTFGARGLVVDWSGANPVMYATTTEANNNRLVKITDTGAASTATSLATAGSSSQVFRGLAFVPSGPTGTPTNTATASPTPTNTFTPTNTATASPSATNTATQTNTATNTATPTPTQTPPTGPTFTISQVYGGGGATSGTPTYSHDYVEIKNITTSVQTLNLLKLYYGSALGNFASSSANAFDLPNVSLNPGQYYLVQLGDLGTVGGALPVTPDATTGNLNMAATSGKIALVTGLLPINTCGATLTPCDATQLSYIVDWVAYGAAGNGAANVGEGGNPSVNNGVAIDNTKGSVRKALGCQDTNNNNADFDVVSPPVPRNMSTTILCSDVSPTPTYTPSNTATPTGTATNTGTPTNTATPTPVQTPPTGPTFVLSQVYGGGGTSSGTYQHDYVEIKNITNSVQTLNLLKLYYGSPTGNFASSASNAFSLPDVSLNPGQYYLVQLGSLGTGGIALPTPDAITPNLNMGGDDGKIALVTGLLPENTCGAAATPCSPLQLSYIVDWVAYGAAGNGTAGNGEGGTSVNNNVSLTNTQGGVRKLNGCQDTNDNNADFDVVTPPVPRNSTTTAPCSGVTATNTATPTATNTSTPTATNTNTPTATATATPTATAGGTSIRGTVTYGNSNAGVKNISNALVTGTGVPNVTTTTAAQGVTGGQYTLTGFGAGNYVVSLSKTTGQNNVTSNDAALIAQHVAGTVPITSNNKKIAADTSGNNAISSNDAALIARFVAGLGGSGNTNQWRFFVPNPTFPIGASPTTRSYTAPIGNPTGQDFIGILIGEVSGNWTPTNARPAQGPERSTAVAAPKLVTPADNEVLIPVAIAGAVNKGIISYEFDLRYDPSVIQPQPDVVDLAGTVSRGLTAVANANEPGLLRVVMYGAAPIDGNGVLLNLRFTAVGAPGTVSPLTFERIMFNEGDPGTVATDGTVELSAAAANQAEMTGRVVNSMGQGIANVRVTLTDTTGQTRSAVSNGFGVYRFGALTVGQTFTLTVESKSLAFAPLTVSVTGQSVNTDMIAE